MGYKKVSLLQAMTPLCGNCQGTGRRVITESPWVSLSHFVCGVRCSNDIQKQGSTSHPSHEGEEQKTRLPLSRGEQEGGGGGEGGRGSSRDSPASSCRARPREGSDAVQGIKFASVA